MDLPAPLGPSSPTALPVPDTPRRQVIPCRISRRPSLTVRFSSSTTGVVSKASPEGVHGGRSGLQPLIGPAQTLEQHHVHDHTR